MNGDKVKEFRLKKGFTQEELAAIVGVDRTHITKIERGKVKPSLKLLEQISSALGVPLKKFF